MNDTDLIFDYHFDLICQLLFLAGKIQNEQREELFVKGFHKILLYKERTDNPNAPNSFKTGES